MGTSFGARSPCGSRCSSPTGSMHWCRSRRPPSDPRFTPVPACPPSGSTDCCTPSRAAAVVPPGPGGACQAGGARRAAVRARPRRRPRPHEWCAPPVGAKRGQQVTWRSATRTSSRRARSHRCCAAYARRGRHRSARASSSRGLCRRPFASTIARIKPMSAAGKASGSRSSRMAMYWTVHSPPPSSARSCGIASSRLRRPDPMSATFHHGTGREASAARAPSACRGSTRRQPPVARDRGGRA